MKRYSKFQKPKKAWSQWKRYPWLVGDFSRIENWPIAEVEKLRGIGWVIEPPQ